jgi:Zn-dependent protease with chaperone function/ribosomal protein S27AE
MTTDSSEDRAHKGNWVSKLVQPGDFKKSDYEFTSDRHALAIVQAIPGAAWLPRIALNLSLKFQVADLLGRCVLVSSKQFPEIFELTRRTSEILGIKAPPVYLQEDPQVNAYTFGTSDRDVYVVLTRGLLEAINDRELAFVLGHEMGHIKSEHVLYLTTLQWILNTGIFAAAVAIPGLGQIATIVFKPLELGLFRWARRAEITCDRAGLICCQDLVSAQRALATLTFGSKTFKEKIDIDELTQQPRKDWPTWLSELTMTHPYMPKRLQALRLFADSDFYVRRILKETRSFLAPEDLDAGVERLLRDQESIEIDREKEFTDTARLITLMAFGAAWEDGRLTDKEKPLLRDLVATLKLSPEDEESFSKFYAKPLGRDELVKKLRYFKADKKVSVAYAFSIFGAENKALTMSQKSFLKAVSRACGVSDDVAETIIGSVKERKHYFVTECNTNLCANCNMVFSVDQQLCPACGMLASSIDRLTRDPERVVCGECGINYRSSDFTNCPHCGNVHVMQSQVAQPVY